MKNFRIGTIPLGVILIAIGALMIFSLFSSISFIEQLYYWWPVSLILLGIDILLHVYLKDNNKKIKFDIISIISIFVIVLLIIISYNAITYSNLGSIDNTNIIMHYF